MCFLCTDNVYKYVSAYNLLPSIVEFEYRKADNHKCAITLTEFLFIFVTD